MFGIGILYLTEVSGHPIPFISTGKNYFVESDQKTTFFGEFSIYPSVIGVATRPKDIESGFKIHSDPQKNALDRKSVFWVGLRAGFGPLWVCPI